MTTNLTDRARALAAKFGTTADLVRSPLLLAMRVTWGWGFFRTGMGKLGNFDGTAAYFSSLHIPAPTLNAAAAAATECAGGLLLLAGLGSRVVAVPLTVTMLVAYATAHADSLGDLDSFVVQAPFPFLVTALVVLAFGPGAFSLDALLARRRAASAESRLLTQ